jgi:23S rRNA A1618 N6-methylase RlmF
MTIEYSSEKDLKKLEKILIEHDYSLVEEKSPDNSSTQTSISKR